MHGLSPVGGVTSWMQLHPRELSAASSVSAAPSTWPGSARSGLMGEAAQHLMTAASRPGRCGCGCSGKHWADVIM